MVTDVFIDTIGKAVEISSAPVQFLPFRVNGRLRRASMFMATTSGTSTPDCVMRKIPVMVSWNSWIIGLLVRGLMMLRSRDARYRSSVAEAMD